MKTYIISLKNSDERRRSISAQAATHALDYEFIDAVNGREIPANVINFLRKKESYAITPGEIGCSMSHLIAYEKLLHSGDEHALILEDDVIIPANIHICLEDLAAHINPNKPYVCLLSKVNQYNKKPLIRLTENNALHQVYNAAFSHAYVINRKAAQNLVDNLFPIWCVADQWSTFKDFGHIHLLGVIPACINTHPEFEKITTIADRDGTAIQRQKKQAWKAIYANRPLKEKIKKALHLLFKRPFIDIVKH
ncbi:glycosyl transferase family 25 [Enterobacter sp. AG5470]|nr:glycosyl transferase family 25 [Enterobacter sp. AG5470]